MRRPWLALVLLAVATAPLAAQDRPALERRFRERLAEVMRTRLGLNDQQVRQLGDVNDTFEARRRALFQEEREVRLGLRRNLMGETEGSNDEVATLLDRAMKIERRRLDLMEEEQGALAKFLTPIQRAKYFGMQEQLRRRMDEMRDRREGPRGGPGFGPPPDSMPGRLRPRRPRPVPPGTS